MYVDRIAVAEQHRDQGIGSMLYEQVIASSEEHGVPVVAEVNSTPPNPGSMRFHERFRFKEVGELHHQDKSVMMLLRT
jgi:predicted GNAT superfamily acetyltransferase